MKVEIKIGDPVPVEENPQDCFVVQVFLMHGDADDYTHFTMGPFATATHLSPEHGDLATVLQFLEAARKLNNERWSRARATLRELENWNLFEHLWEIDNTCDDWDRLARYDTHRVRYFDEHGKEFATTYSLAAI